MSFSSGPRHEKLAQKVGANCPKDDITAATSGAYIQLQNDTRKASIARRKSRCRHPWPTHGGEPGHMQQSSGADGKERALSQIPHEPCFPAARPCSPPMVGGGYPSLMVTASMVTGAPALVPSRSPTLAKASQRTVRQ
ncbi:Hypothetical predicted protein, partial [Pelobates cultripes]